MIDPAAPAPSTPDAHVYSKLATLERRISDLLTSGRPAVGNTAPDADPTKLPEGAEYIDRVARRKYYVIGDGVSPATHVWRYVALT